MADSRPSAFRGRIDWDIDGTYSGDDLISDNGELLARTDISIRYGRDQSRAFAPMAPGVANFDVNNVSGKYSPENTGSPIYGKMDTGKPAQIAAVYEGDEYPLYTGNLDNYKVNPGANTQSVSFSFQDVIGQAATIDLSTPVYEVLRSGHAVHVILDAIGWPLELRDIDPGATHFRYWYVEGQTAFDALKQVQDSEGPPSVMYVRKDGYFVFRDRHHRILRTESTDVQETFTGGVTQPAFKRDSFEHESGYKEIVNSVTIDVDSVLPEPNMSTVWESSQQITVQAGETYVLKVVSSDPFMHAQPFNSILGDVVVTFGTLDISLSRDSGKSAYIYVTGITTGQLSYIRLRARKITSQGSVSVIQQDTGSISAHGREKSGGPDGMPFTTIWDALAVAQATLAQRAYRKPTVTFTVQSRNAVTTQNQLTREISDRIHVVENQSFVDGAYYIEQIEHVITGTGTLLETKYGCEKTADIPGNVFRFDQAGNGFDDGVFAQLGFNDPDTVFIFDTPGRGFDDGTFAV